VPKFAELSESNQPNRPNGPTPNPPPGPRQSFSAPLYIDNLLLSHANSVGFQGSKPSVESYFDQFGDGGSSKHEDDDLASEMAQRRGDEIIILLRIIGELDKRTRDLGQNQRINFWNLQKAQIKSWRHSAILRRLSKANSKFGSLAIILP
jgi:hypothetical protein